MKTFSDKPEYRAHFADDGTDYPYQAQWYTGTRYHADGYERGGWYATEADAMKAAARGKWMDAVLKRLADEKGNNHE